MLIMVFPKFHASFVLWCLISITTCRIVASYPGPEIGPGINRLAHAPLLRGNIDGNGYDVQIGRRVSTIRHPCFIIISCVNFRELAKSSQLALERSVQQVSLKRTKASSAKVVSPETSRCRPPSKLPRKDYNLMAPESRYSYRIQWAATQKRLYRCR